MTDPDTTDCHGGNHHTVSEEQLAAFARLTPLQRLDWVEAAREFTLLTETPDNRERRQRLRQGKTIV